MSVVEVTRGNSPLVLGLPHTGTYVPESVLDCLNANGRALADTDWHIHRLYDGLVDATTVRTTTHRYVIDANRDPGGGSLYPGQNTTALCPTTDFDGRPIYREHQAPDADEIEARRIAHHAPYHAALTAELDRAQAQFGFAVLYDCHSIRSRIPFLFDGRLPDLSIGTNGGATCHAEVEALVCAACDGAYGLTSVLNGRFRGGWTTRHYGCPQDGVHAIQMEIAQSTYLAEEAPPWPWDSAKADRLRVILRPLLQSLCDWRPS
ncbi:formiminoglutamase [Aliiruegeria haliotis]|uniref:Formiminoglutamase n=1 Tax=Aliiruegeria haliotis TaxID=1280846 RepID=A0A2T0RW96_9RHOB|nr:N-formylglutamate deformylase [Aliiruegeria haliotis]PRY25459.1 formiminoglutamase [Aliiruegeria haliotis]